jgi:GDP-4-dehydro-6-deoxy-D-mannose reductase
VRALITGGRGFVGRWLTRALLERGDDVDLADVSDSTGPKDRESATRWMAADMRRDDDVEAMVEWSRPDAVFHLAGVSFQPDADRSPTTAYDVNALAAVRLLAAIARRRAAGVLDPVVLVAGTAMQYGQHAAEEMPLVETATQRPPTVYAASKAAQEIAALQLAMSSGVRVVCTRSFNHSGRGQAEQFLIPSLVARVRRIQRGETRTLQLGNDVIRDFLHVDDAVSAYLHLVDRGRAGEVYNVCSGTGVSARHLAERVLLRTGVAADISTEPSLVRATDVPVLVGSPAKLERDTGWTPRKTHDDIIDDLLHATTD